MAEPSLKAYRIPYPGTLGSSVDIREIPKLVDSGSRLPKADDPRTIKSVRTEAPNRGDWRVIRPLPSRLVLPWHPYMTEDRRGELIRYFVNATLPHVAQAFPQQQFNPNSRLLIQRALATELHVFENAVSPHHYLSAVSRRYREAEAAFRWRARLVLKILKSKNPSARKPYFIEQMKRIQKPALAVQTSAALPLASPHSHPYFDGIPSSYHLYQAFAAHRLNPLFAQHQSALLNQGLGETPGIMSDQRLGVEIPLDQGGARSGLTYSPSTASPHSSHSPSSSSDGSTTALSDPSPSDWPSERGEILQLPTRLQEDDQSSLGSVKRPIPQLPGLPNFTTQLRF